MVAAKLKNMNLSLFAIVMEGVLSRFSFGAINLALPLFARHLGLSLAEIGVLLSVRAMVGMALKPLLSGAIDRFGENRGFVLGIGLRSLVPFLFALTGTPWMLYGAAGVHGISKSVRDTSVDSLIVEHSKHNNVGSAFAWYSTAKSVAGALGKGAAGIFLTMTASNYFMVFVLAGVVSASSLAAARFVKEVRGQDQSGEAEVSPPGMVGRASEAASGARRPGFLVSILPFLGFGCFISGVGQMLDVLFPILAVEYGGMSEAEVGVVFMAATAVVLLAGPAWGWLSDHLSKKLVLLAPGISNAVASVLFLVFPNALGMASGRLADDTGKAAFRPAWGTVMGQISALNPGHRGRVVGYMGMGKDAGEIAGPIVASLIWTVWGVPILLVIRVALAIGAELYSLTLLGYIKRLAAETPPTKPEGPESDADPSPGPTATDHR